ncbi:MAG: hypothetical protein ACFFAN_17740 [Promethearchaeota archaeon]
MAVILVPIQIVDAVFSIVQLMISFIIASLLILKYIKYKESTFLWFALGLIFMNSEVWGTTIAFILILTTGNGLSFELFFILNYGFVFLYWIMWALGFTKLIYKNERNYIVAIIGAWGILFEIFFFVFLFTNPSLIGYLINDFTPIGGLFLAINRILGFALFIIWGILIFRETKKSDDPEIRLKGKIYLISLLTLVIGIIILIVALFTINIILVILGRIAVIFSFIGIYIAIVLPDWAKRFLLKK